MTSPTNALVLTREVLDQRHPIYAANHAAWRYYRDHYAGGVEYPSKVNPIQIAVQPRQTSQGNSGVSRYLWQYQIEGSDVYAHRLARAVYPNIPAPIIDFFVAQVGKAENVLLTLPESDQEARQIQDDLDMTGQSYLQVMAKARANAAVAGHTFLFVDSTRAETEVLTEAQRRAAGIRPYVYEILAEDLLNWRIGEDGQPTEVLFRVDVDPEASLLAKADQAPVKEYRYWSREGWLALRVEGDKVVTRNTGTNPLGEIPIVCLYHRRLKPWLGQSILKDAARYCQLACNWLSALTHAFEHQMFAVPVLKSRQKPSDVGVGVTTVLHLNPDDNEDFTYVAPDTAPFETSWNAFYRLVALANKQMHLAPTAISTENADEKSGRSKAWDYHEAATVMADMAENEQEAAKHLWYFIYRWRGQQEFPGSVAYATDYDMETLSGLIDNLIKMQAAGLPGSVQQQMMRRIVAKALPSLPIAVQQEIDAEIEAAAVSLGIPEFSPIAGSGDMRESPRGEN